MEDPSTSALIVHGTALDHLRSMPDESVDSVVCDPPYGLSSTGPRHVTEAITRWVSGDREFIPSGTGFMGRSWDSFVPPPALWDECLRVLKPGGHLAAFAGSRTMDLMTLSIRLSGFDIRDSLAWIYGSGMPHGQDVGKAIAKRSGEGAAEPWQDWNTALKPAFEPIVLARKPLAEKTVAGNVLERGVGALNIGATRISHRSAADLAESTEKNRHSDFGTAPGGNAVYGDFSMVSRKNYSGATGRHPANVVLSHSQGCVRTGDTEVRTSTHFPASRPAGGIGSTGHRGQEDLAESAPKTETVASWECEPGCQVAELDSSPKAPKGVGGPSRFFLTTELDDAPARFRYCAKAKPKERPKYTDEDGKVVQHVSVKPLEIMRWLVRLLTPAGGTVLDPFAGSGTTMEAAALEGFDSVTVEMDERYIPLITQRAQRVPGLSWDVLASRGSVAAH